MFTLIYSSFILPLRMSFHSDEYSNWIYLDMIITIIFLLDILVEFNRVSLDLKGGYLKERKNIAKNYLKCWFWIDFLSVFPFNLIFGYCNFIQHGLKNLKMLKMFNLTKILQIMKLIHFFNCKAPRNGINQIFLKISATKIYFYGQLLTNMIVIHWFTCLMIFIPKTVTADKNWMKERKINSLSYFEQYLFSFHWIIETFITVGFGENPVE